MEVVTAADRGSSESPYQISSADLQVTTLVSPELVDGNYVSWKRAWELALTTRNKKGFIDGTIKQPKTDDAKYGAWLRCDNLVKAWLQKSVSTPIASTIFYLTTAKEIWDELAERYGVPPMMHESINCRSNTQP